MTYMLTAVAGAHQGRFWTVEEKPLILGRALNCDIVLADPLVSRRHCQIFCKGDSVAYEDLGSRNPALVNSIPCKRSVLEAGDEISMGKDVFLLGFETADPRLRGTDPITPCETVSLAAGEPIRLDGAFAGTGSSGVPRTVYDLVSLHTTSREFCSCTSLSGLMSLVTARLRDRFAPSTLWMARSYGVDDLVFYDTNRLEDVACPSAPLDAIHESLRSGHALLVPAQSTKAGGDTRIFTMVTPGAIGDDVVIVLAVQTESPHGVYKEWDLQYLVLFAQALAPFVFALENVEQLRRENEQLRAESGQSRYLVGQSQEIRKVRDEIAKAAKTPLNVLVTGETGTGKELAARVLHVQSDRATGPLVVVNCAAIPRELFEAQLFGYEKGSFTGADKESVGLAGQAHGGTLFLDEVGDLSLDNQARILRLIENGTFQRVGAEHEIYVDIRVVAATNIDLAAALAEGSLRQDLYQRLRGFVIDLPPLRERPSDIAVLAEHFFQMAKERAKRPLTHLSPDAIEYLRTREWPGNVRELRNCIQRAVAVAAQETIQPEDVFDPTVGATEKSSGEGTRLSLVEAEKHHIIAVLKNCSGDVREAAGLLGVGRSTLYRKIAEYDIRV